MFTYIRSEKYLWTVGFYEPDGRWNPESDHGTPEDAAERVAYLNGSDTDNADRVKRLEEILRMALNNEGILGPDDLDDANPWAIKAVEDVGYPQNPWLPTE